MMLSAGTRLGRYEIRAKIGAGGMGEVYRAFDNDLDRTVAIKILPPALASNQQRLQRFTQEAKAASALNHPHILTIHEIGTAGATRFIATEFIDGETLRVSINAGMKLSDILEVATQTASALAAAHDAGIVHRDIKPENIMVRRDGFVKVLDFGLAKLVEPKDSATDAEAPTRAMVNTDAGTVMGTANYMSPEQAKGTPMDSRTDLWSLGAVLYEMIAGQVPFAGETPTETISLILQREAAPLSHYADEVPAELERIVKKSLTKDRDERYQTAKDFLIDLRNLKRKLEVDAEIDRSVPTELRAALSTRSGQASLGTGSGTARTHMGPTGARASSAEFVFGEMRKHKIAVAVISCVALLALMGGIIGVFLLVRARNAEAAIDSIAVLPFENPDPATEYLSDGVTESIINNLSQLPNLRVTPRSTVFHYKGKATDPVVTGKDLGVRAVLTGRVFQRGDNLTVSVELVDIRDNKQLLGEQYNRKVADALALQQDISREISERLRVKLPGSSQPQLAKRNPGNPQAYQLYLKGRYYMLKGTEEGITKGVEHFNQALELDPNYALAYAGLADSYYGLSDLKYAPRDSMPRVKAAAERALQIDPTLAEAHTSLAIAFAQYDWDWSRSESEFRRAIELDPDYVFAHHQYAWMLAVSGRQNEAITEFNRALQLDPLSVLITVDNNVPYVLSKQYDRGLDFAKKGEEMDANFFLAHFVQGWIYDKKGDYEKSIARLQKARQLENQPWIFCWLGHAYAASGDPQKAQKIIDELNDLSKRRYVSPYFTATVYAGLKDKEKTIEYLEKAYQDKSIWLVWLRVEDIFDFLREDPRFQDLLRRIGLPQ
jgi:serine/threonine protein kinase/tetratricopeptide (TPR) repeat protein